MTSSRMNYLSHAWSFDRTCCKVFIAHISGSFPASGDTLRLDDDSGVGLKILGSQWLDESRDSGVRVLFVGGDQADAVNALYEGVPLVGGKVPVTFGALSGKVHITPEFDAPLPPDVQSSFEYWEPVAEDSSRLPRPALEERRDARRLALHQAAVRAIREHPERAEYALAILNSWIAKGFANQELAEEWRRLIESRNWDAFLEDSGHGKRLRKGSPVACVVDQEERLTIIRRFRASGEAAAE